MWKVQNMDEKGNKAFLELFVKVPLLIHATGALLWAFLSLGGAESAISFSHLHLFVALAHGEAVVK